jgi:hypothetical protein
MCPESPLPSLLATLASLLALAAGPAPLPGHHSVLGFDSSRQVAVRGVVREVIWSYPHVSLSVEEAGADGETVRWRVEIESPTVLERLGWTRESVRAGDRIETTGARARNGDRRMRCDTVATEDGVRLPCYPRLARPGLRPSSASGS